MQFERGLYSPVSYGTVKPLLAPAMMRVNNCLYKKKKKKTTTGWFILIRGRWGKKSGEKEEGGNRGETKWIRVD